MIILSILFFVTAILYSSVGFGGGSAYLALLLISGVPYFIFPILALSCNITPRTAPTRVWVVDTGKASLEANTIVMAAPNSAAKPLVGVN